jgi:hypothetical protein
MIYPKIGDILKSKNEFHEDKEVLGICGKIVFVIDSVGWVHEMNINMYTREQLQVFGYEVVGSVLDSPNK